MATRVDIVILGTGAGATAVYTQECSSSFVLRVDGKTLLIADVGFGVVSRCIATVGSIPASVYVSHNHSDHAAELPVLLKADGRVFDVYCEGGVMARVLEHRLHELRSTGACRVGGLGTG